MKKVQTVELMGALFVLFIAIVACAIWYNADKFVVEMNQPASKKSFLAERISKGEKKQDILYCGQNRLDYYAPTALLDQRSPLVIYIHGGGWHMNNKNSDEEIRKLFMGLRNKGYALASIDYSLTPENKFPYPQQDATCAVRFMRANANRFGIDSDKIAITGFSAGANLAALVGANDNNLFNNGQYKMTSSRVRAVIGISGVYDFTNNLRPNSTANIKNLMQEANPRSGSPITYVTHENAPTMLIYGEKDTTVLPVQSINYANELTKNQVFVMTVPVKSAEHDLSPNSSDISPSHQEIASQIETFLNQQLGL